MHKPLKNILMPKDHSLFGAKRKHDMHTGIDLYADVGSEVYAIEDGCVMKVEKFTGPDVFLPWWNTTYYVGVMTKSKLTDITDLEYGTLGLFTRDHSMYISCFIYPQFRGQGLLRHTVNHYNLPIITVSDCGIEEYLQAHGIEHLVVKT